MSEKVVFSQLSRKFIDENDATPAEAQQVVYYSLAIGHHTLGLSIAWKRRSPVRGMNIWHGLPLWRRAAKPAAKWKACRNMVRSSSTLTMCRCWPTHSIKPGLRKLRSRKNGVQCC